MKLDLQLVLEHFCVDGGILYRKFASGTVKRVQTLEAGRLVSMVGGRKYYGPDIAWVCHYQAVPEYRIVVINLDPHDMSIENLAAARLHRYNFRLIEAPGGWRHPLSFQVYRSKERAQADWVDRVRSLYQKDMDYVLFRQRTRAPEVASMVVEQAPRVVRPRGPAKSGPRPPQPQNVAGRKWFWYKGEWVSLPLAVHPSDDWRVRAAAVLKDHNVRFVYDPKADRTLPVWSKVVA